ncbi:uncharacterized protein LOC132563474 [Ylistrum balloti]|uniref:uncharacterized protein LOC132563474 n=1 Tax=Ylistrum balloti TaxID=509963 RepID=UPI002905E75A|nr:uncharacterized protein LOC132563474 [Ylistrum balloti]
MISRTFLILGLAYLCSGQMQDQTRVPGASGSAVVEAVINLIHESCIFPNDRLYLRRLAYVESQDGTANDTYRVGYNGGIWQIDEDQFKQTQSAVMLATARALLRNTLTIDWSSAKWEDLRKPLYSGVAAALYTLLKSGSGVLPSSVEKQSSFWINTTKHTIFDANKYYKAVNELQGGCRSTNAIDLVFVVDSSASLSPSDFDITKQFVKDVVDQFDIGPQTARVAVVEFSTAVSASFLLNQFDTKDAVKKAVDGIIYSPGGTNTAAAIDKTVNEVFATVNGARNGAAKVMILITDGRSENTVNTLNAANNARLSGITIFTLGVTQYVNKIELDGIASSPSCTHSQILNSYADLDSLKTQIQSVSCKAAAILTPNNYQYNCGSDINVQILPNVTAGTTVTVTPTDGTVSVFGSLTSANPSPVLNEFYKIADINAGQSFYVRGNRSVALAVMSTYPTKTCAGNFNITVEEGNNIRPYNNLLCIEAGRIIVNCSAQTLFGSQYMVVPTPYSPNPCSSSGIQIFPHPLRNDRFLYCDGNGNVFEVLCPFMEIFDLQAQTCIPGMPMTFTLPRTTMTPLPSVTPRPTNAVVQTGNPCTPENILNGLFFFPYPNDDQAYIECYNLPYVAVVKFCEPHHFWDQATLTCLYREVVVDPTKGAFGSNSKPCGTVPDLFFYPHPSDPQKYIHCDQYGDAFEKICKPYFIWRQDILNCVPRGLFVMSTVPVPVVGKK